MLGGGPNLTHLKLSRSCLERDNYCVTMLGVDGNLQRVAGVKRSQVKWTMLKSLGLTGSDPSCLG